MLLFFFVFLGYNFYIIMNKAFREHGPIDVKKDYYVSRKEYVERALSLIEDGRYFTVFAPRQTGKTSLLDFIEEAVCKTENYIVISLSVEGYFTFSSQGFYKALYRDIQLLMQKQLRLKKIDTEKINEFLESFEVYDIESLILFFDTLYKLMPDYRLIFMIDEFEGMPESQIGVLMHNLRQQYHKGKDNISFLKSVILAGLSNIADIILDKTSPFNINEQISLKDFSLEEVQELYSQYTAETGQKPSKQALNEIHYQTGGQPSLVNSLGRILTVDMNINPPVYPLAPYISSPLTGESLSRTCFGNEGEGEIITKDHVSLAVERLIRQENKNIINMLAKTKQYKDFALKIIFQKEENVDFNIYREEIKHLSINGVIENINGNAEIKNPIYKKAILRAFKPLLNGNGIDFMSYTKSTKDYLKDNFLDMPAIIDNYAKYVIKRGFRLGEITETGKEALWHYSLDGYLHFFIENLGGQIFTEVPTGRGRTDLILIHNNKKYILELKVWKSKDRFENGKIQLAQYLITEGLDEGYYIVFSDVHGKHIKKVEEINNRKIYIFIINVKPKVPSKKKRKK